MRSQLLRTALFLVVGLSLGGSSTLAQAIPDPAPDPGADYRRYFKRPTTVAEFWSAMQFEIDVGQYELAAAHLQGLLDLKPDPATLVNLQRRVGTNAILRLRNRPPKWSDDPKKDKQAKDNVETFIKEVTKAVKEHYQNEERIKLYVKQLGASREEYLYALKELALSGPLVVPHILSAYQSARGSERLPYLRALTSLGSDIVPPLVAALDSKDTQLKVDIINVLRQRGEADAAPHLWFVAGNPREAKVIRAKAREALSLLLDTAPANLPDPRQALTREADRYYRHRVKFTDPRAVTIWRWDGTNVVTGWPKVPTVTASQAEEYFGSRFTRQALTIDPTYEPAQVLLLSLLVDKAYERAGLDKTLAKSETRVNNLLGSVRSDLVLAMLDRAIRENQVPAMVGAIRELGRRAEPRALLARRGSQPSIIRALFYPDRRVQFAAAQALTTTPGKPGVQALQRVVDIFRRAVAAYPEERSKPNVLIGYSNRDLLDRVTGKVTEAGFTPVRVQTGRDLMRRLAKAADIDLILFEANLPKPGLASLLGQLRADTYAGRIPVIVSVPSTNFERIQRYAIRYPQVTVIPVGAALDAELLAKVFQDRIAVPSRPVLEESERKEHAEAAAQALARMASGALKDYDIQPAGPTVLQALEDGKLSEDGQKALAQVATMLPGRNVQTTLGRMVTSQARPVAVRAAAADALVKHMQERGVLLNAAQTGELFKVHSDPETKPELKASLARVLGSLRSGSRTTGNRLLRYDPGVPGAKPAKK